MCTVLDPMAGLGRFMTDLAWEGHRVLLGDLNPAVLLLAHLRDPHLSEHGGSLGDKLQHRIEEMANELDSAKQESKYVSEWAPDVTKLALKAYVKHLGINSDLNPSSEEFWQQSKETLFRISIPILAARGLTTFTRTDNSTWIKPGGVWVPRYISQVIMDTLSRWRQLVGSQIGQRPLGPAVGEMTVRHMDAESGFFPINDKADVVITSPPYANRLDYSRLWGPELAIESSMFPMLDVHGYQTRQLASNFTHFRYDQGEEESLPPSIRDALQQLVTSQRVRSKAYYYRYFKNYAIGLHKAFKSIGKQVRKGGTIVIFIRDTVAADILFETHKIIGQTLEQESFVLDQDLGAVQKTIRNHVGVIRGNRNIGLYGLAQREWWLVYRKEV